LAAHISSLIGWRPDNIQIYKTAFLHKSLLNESDETLQSNERLEYLGDAILNSIVAEYFFKKYPQEDEGFLTKMRSKVVKRGTLNEIAEKMELDVLLREYNNTKISHSMLGNAFEALVGAIYLDKGYKKTKIFVIQRVLQRHIDLDAIEKLNDNYKSRLLEWCQKSGHTINYQVLEKYKQRNRDKFRVEVLIDGESVASGEGFNKKGAEQKASAKAIMAMNIEG
jgi:ribonuclease-3